MDNSLTLPFTGKLNLRLGYTEMLRQVKCPYIRLNADGVCLKETEVGCYDKDSNYLIWNEVFRVKLLQVTKISVVIFDKRLLGDDDFVAIGEVELSKLTNGGKKNVMLKHKFSLLPNGFLHGIIQLVCSDFHTYLSVAQCAQHFDNIQINEKLSDRPIVSIYGHQFMATTFRQPTLCSMCKGLLVGIVRQGQQCVLCNMVAHYNCTNFIYRVCIFDAKEGPRPPPIERVQPTGIIQPVIFGQHRFYLRTYLTPTYCSHCGTMLYGLYKQGFRCCDCEINVHSWCKDNVVRTCAEI